MKSNKSYLQVQYIPKKASSIPFLSW